GAKRGNVSLNGTSFLQTVRLYFKATKIPEFVSIQDFKDDILGKGRRLAASEIVAISFNLKKSIIAKTISIGFSQVTQSKDVRKFLENTENTSDGQIQALSKIMHKDNLPIPKSMETEVTVS